MISDFKYSRISFKIQNPYFSNQDTLCISLFIESLKYLYHIYMQDVLYNNTLICIKFKQR